MRADTIQVKEKKRDDPHYYISVMKCVCM